MSDIDARIRRDIYDMLERIVQSGGARRAKVLPVRMARRPRKLVAKKRVVRRRRAGGAEGGSDGCADGGRVRIRRVRVRKLAKAKLQPRGRPRKAPVRRRRERRGAGEGGAEGGRRKAVRSEEHT